MNKDAHINTLMDSNFQTGMTPVTAGSNNDGQGNGIDAPPTEMEKHRCSRHKKHQQQQPIQHTSP